MVATQDIVLSLVLPVFNEADHLEFSFNIIRSVLDTLTLPYEVIIVDDGSKDNTWTVIEGLTQQNSVVKGISFSRNFGKESAIVAGLRQARGQAVILMDADLQHPPMLIPEMTRIWREGLYQVINAQKTFRGDESYILKFLSGSFYFVYRIFTGFDLKNQSDFKLLDRRVVDAYLALEERNLFFRGIIPWLGFSQTYVGFQVQARASGGSKWPLVRRFLLGVSSITSFSTVPLQFVTLCGFLFLFLAVGMIVQTLYNWAEGRAVEGFTTVIILLLVIGFLLMFSLGVIGEYLAKIYQESKRRPQYIVRNSVRIDIKKDMHE